MKTTAQLLDEARQNLEKINERPTFYCLAKRMGVSDQLLYGHRKRGIVWSDETALKTSPFLPYPPELLLVWAKMEREKNPEVLQVLQRLEERVMAA